MKFSRLTSAVIAAVTAITPLSLNSSVLHTPSAVYAEGTNTASANQDWIPTDFESAMEFRNTYGATHIENGYVCIVYQMEYEKIDPEIFIHNLRYQFRYEGSSLRRESIESYTHFKEPVVGDTEYCVMLFSVESSGMYEVDMIDNALRTSPDKEHPKSIGHYSFYVDRSGNITETDIYSWLPDSTNEYNEYTKMHGEVSVKDNYVLFCTRAVDQFGDRWEPDSSNKNENIKYIMSSDCTMEDRNLYDDGSIDKIYVYRAEKDGTEKISWVRTSNYRPNQAEPTHYILTADCAVLDNAQTILLAGQMRAALVDYDTGKPLVLSEGKTPYIWTNISDGTAATGPILVMETNPAIVSEDLGGFSDSKNFSFGLEDRDLPDGYSFTDGEERPSYYSGTIIPENSMTVSKFDNGSVNVVFRLKYNSTGDVNGDGSFGISDAVTLQQWLLGSKKVSLKKWRAADFNKDNKLDVFDLILMRKALLRSAAFPVEVSVKEETGGVVGAVLLYNVYREADKCYFSYQDRTYYYDAEPMVIQISESDYREIMAQDYESMIRNMKNYTEPEFDEGSFDLELSYPDGSKTKTVSAKVPAVLEKLKALKKKYFTYVEPDRNISYGAEILVITDDQKLYLGPDTSYSFITTIPNHTRLRELGVQNNNDNWAFVEYNGQHGWIQEVSDEGITQFIINLPVAAKPVIYLYPQHETDVHVELELTEAELSTTYPKYNNGWDVTASPDGSLTNKADGTHHKYLFWDAVNCRTKFDFSKGFCVAGGDTESFLKEKLTYMGLTEEEMNEFIVYWLPLMEHNKYNLITFQGDAYTNSAKLNITPRPDSLIRIFMAYVPLEEKVDIEPQQLETFERKGFTVVEWGGSEIGA